MSSLPLVGENVAFTGTLASMTHREAIRLVEQFGGRATQTVSGSTTMLVIGEEGWPLEPDGGTSQKLQQTMQLVAHGSDARILSESDWLQLLNLDEHREEIRRSHTPAMLSQLLDVPVRMIRRWARLGLIRPVRRVCRLPYFDYREGPARDDWRYCWIRVSRPKCSNAVSQNSAKQWRALIVRSLS